MDFDSIRKAINQTSEEFNRTSLMEIEIGTTKKAPTEEGQHRLIDEGQPNQGLEEQKQGEEEEEEVNEDQVRFQLRTILIIYYA